MDPSVPALSQTRPCISEALGSAQYLHNGDETQNLYRYLVIGGCLDVEFEGASRQLMDMFTRGEALLVLSDLTLLELQEAPVDVRTVLEKVPEKHREYVELTEEATILAQHYIDTEVIGAARRVDAQHNCHCHD